MLCDLNDIPDQKATGPDGLEVGVSGGGGVTRDWRQEASRRQKKQEKREGFPLQYSEEMEQLGRKLETNSPNSFYIHYSVY